MLKHRHNKLILAAAVFGFIMAFAFAIQFAGFVSLADNHQAPVAGVQIQQDQTGDAQLQPANSESFQSTGSYFPTRRLAR